MRYLSLFVAGVLASALASSALAADAPVGERYVVSHFEALPSHAAQVAAQTRQYVAAARREPGAVAVEAYQEIARPNRFVLLEQWRDQGAFDAHGPAAAGFRQTLAPQMMSDVAYRMHSAFLMGPSAPPPSGSAVTVITHLDVFPAGTDQEVALVTAKAEAARKDSGNIRFDVLRWDGHRNHFTLVEVWRNAEARLAATALEHNRQFRAKSTPLEGAPYDDRLYRRLE